MRDFDILTIEAITESAFPHVHVGNFQIGCASFVMSRDESAGSRLFVPNDFQDPTICNQNYKTRVALSTFLYILPSSFDSFVFFCSSIDLSPSLKFALKAHIITRLSAILTQVQKRMTVANHPHDVWTTIGAY